MGIPSPFLRKSIASLKKSYPAKVAFIEADLQNYLDEDGPVADDEFVFGLKNRLEATHPPISAVNPPTPARKRISRRR
jgi:hypothetical protein